MEKKEEYAQDDKGSYEMGYVCLPGEIKKIIQEQFPLQLQVNHQVKKNQNSCSFVYHKKNRVKKLLTSVNPVSIAKSYIAPPFPDDDIKVHPLFFIDECGKEYFLDKVSEDASVVGPFEMKGETYVAVNAVKGPVVGPFEFKSETMVFYNKTADGFTPSKKYQILAGQQRRPKLLYAHPQGHYLITINRGETHQWYKITPQDNGTFAQEEILKTDRLYYQYRGDEKVWPIAENKIACLCNYQDSFDYWIKKFDITVNKVTDEINITKIFNKIYRKYEDKIFKKLCIEYEKNPDCGKYTIPYYVMYSMQNVEYSPQQKMLLFNSIIAGPPVPEKDIKYLAMINFLYSIPSGESQIVSDCKIIKAGKKDFQYAAKIFCCFGPQLTTQARIIPKKTQIFSSEIHFCRNVDDDMLINAACWWLRSSHKKLNHGLALIRAVNSAQSTVWLNYISSYKKGKPYLSIVYDTLHNCKLLENIKKRERVYLFKEVYRVMRICLIQNMIKKVKRRKIGPLTKEKAVTMQQFEKSTYEDFLVFPLHTYVDGNKARNKPRESNLTFVKQIKAAWKTQDRKALKKIVKKFSKL